jgi:hypothetical protein
MQWVWSIIHKPVGLTGCVGAAARQDKLLRTGMLECLGLCVRTWLRRYAGGEPKEAAAGAARERAERWLAKATRPVIANLRKGNLQFSEQQVRHCPDVSPGCSSSFWLPNSDSAAPLQLPLVEFLHHLNISCSP